MVPHPSHLFFICSLASHTMQDIEPTEQRGTKRQCPSDQAPPSKQAKGKEKETDKADSTTLPFPLLLPNSSPSQSSSSSSSTPSQPPSTPPLHFLCTATGCRRDYSTCSNMLVHFHKQHQPPLSTSSPLSITLPASLSFNQCLKQMDTLHHTTTAATAAVAAQATQLQAEIITIHHHLDNFNPLLCRNQVTTVSINATNKHQLKEQVTVLDIELHHTLALL